MHSETQTAPAILVEIIHELGAVHSDPKARCTLKRYLHNIVLHVREHGIGDSSALLKPMRSVLAVANGAPKAKVACETRRVRRSYPTVLPVESMDNPIFGAEALLSFAITSAGVPVIRPERVLKNPGRPEHHLCARRLLHALPRVPRNALVIAVSKRAALTAHQSNDNSRGPVEPRCSITHRWQLLPEWLWRGLFAQDTIGAQEEFVQKLPIRLNPVAVAGMRELKLNYIVGCAIGRQTSRIHAVLYLAAPSQDGLDVCFCPCKLGRDFVP
mmetsp:Transcript_26928/g.75868  ORF Transcript_26928/g.75868 Transcript_26928/m.75868 type:complete len:271 (-) Transcript_26928:141-953(-)